ncbi:mucin-2 isoform X2 [Anopheles merus]|uniref:mucin-2 isoform X2 n=1 Tax=Anopheles merus TaxID=30066 RepID=UPI001BE4DEBB|nr:mucin-2 isoform X2 [Anopheles merus]
MDPRWLLLAVFCLFYQNLAFGSLTTEEDVPSNTNDTKEWRILQIPRITTPRSGRMTTTIRRMPTKTVARGKTTARSRKRTSAGGRTWTTTKRSGQRLAGPKAPTTISRTTKTALRISSGPNGKVSTTRAKSMQPPTLPPVTSQGEILGRTTKKPRRIPQKIQQGPTTRRSGQKTTTQRPQVRTTTPPVLLRMPPRSSTAVSPLSLFGYQLYSLPFSFFNVPTTTVASSNTTDTSNTTTTENPAVSSSTTETTSTMSTTSSTSTVAPGANATAITSAAAVEYEDDPQEQPNPPEYDYPEEQHNATSPVVTTVAPVTESHNSVSSAAGPHMVRKRRKKVTTTTAGPSPGMIRIRVRRKRTTVAPAVDAIAESSS